MKYLFYTVCLSFMIFSCGNESVKPEDTTNSEENAATTTETNDGIESTPEIDYVKAESEFDSTALSESQPIGELKKEMNGKTAKNAIPAPPKPIENQKSKVAEVIEVVEETIEVPLIKAEIHKTWDDLTRKHISSSGKVNYAGFKSDKAELEKYLKELQSYHADLSSWSKNKQLAYWINVYNAVTVKLIVDNYPVKSITDLHGGKPWDEKLINLGGVSYTLNVIENKIIRPKFNEPRIHFAVNCAAVSCPKILNRAWTEDNIQRYLTQQTKAFIANASQNNLGEDKIVISKIFDWYKADFGTSNENVIKFINKYSDTKVSENAVITYNEYNWSLNN